MLGRAAPFLLRSLRRIPVRPAQVGALISARRPGPWGMVRHASKGKTLFYCSECGGETTKVRCARCTPRNGLHSWLHICFGGAVEGPV